MKKLLCAFLGVFMLCSITVSAISNDDVKECRYEQSKGYAEKLKATKTKSGESVLDYIDSSEILPVYAIYDSENDFSKFKGKISSCFSNELLDIFCKSKKLDKVYSVEELAEYGEMKDYSDVCGILFDDKAVAEALTGAEVNSIKDMKIVHKYGFHLYVDTDNGEYIIPSKNIQWNKLPSITLKKMTAYTAEEFVNYILARQERANEIYKADSDESQVIMTDDGDWIEITPPPASEKPAAAAKPYASAEPKPTKEPVVIKPSPKSADNMPEFVVNQNVIDVIGGNGPVWVTLRDEKHFNSVEQSYNRIVFDEDNAPFIDENGRTQMPLRAISDELEFAVEWNGTEKKITLSKDGSVIIFRLGGDEFTVNGAVKRMDTTPVLVNDHTFIPLRYMGEAVGYSVEYTDRNLVD